jgi:Prohead core protein serine protease
MARIILESAPIPFRYEIVKSDLTEDIEISGNSGAVKPLMKVRGLFQKYDEKNANNRIYPKALFDRCLNEESWMNRIRENSVVGMLEHPEDGITRLTGPISHIVTKAWDKGNGEIWGEATVLNTPDGRKAGALLEAGVPVGISSRGEGEVEEAMHEGVQRVIPESFTLITWDFVADNSVPGARVKPVTGENKSPKKESAETPPAKEYLTSIQNSPMSKNLIGEMRKVGVALKRITATNVKKLGFQEKIGLTEELDDMRATISSYMAEDKAVTAYGNKLLKEMDDFSADFEDKAEEPTDAGSNLPPGVGGEEEGGAEEGGAEVDQATFDEVLRAVLKGMSPGCEDADLSGAYQEFCDKGEVDVHGIISSCKQGEGEGDMGGDDFAEAPIGGGEENGGGGEEDFGKETAFESKELRAAVQLIAHLRESAVNGERYRQFADELKERIRVHHPLLKELEEARKKLATVEGSKEWEARIERNKTLLARAKTEISTLQAALGEEREISNALVTLLREHGIKDASKISEGDPEFMKKILAKKKEGGDAKAAGAKNGKPAVGAKKEKEEESRVFEDLTGTDGTKGGKSGTAAIGPGDCDMAGPGDGKAAADPDEELEDGEGDSATKVGGADQKVKDGTKGSGKSALGPGDGKVIGPSGASESKLKESKAAEEHDLLRIVTRHRTNAFSQL